MMKPSLLIPLVLAGCSSVPDTGNCRAYSTTQCGGVILETDVTVAGDLSTCGFVGDGDQPLPVCDLVCPAGTPRCIHSASAPRTVACNPQFCATGRRPEGFEPSSRDLAALAELEAASVVAFDTLSRELAHHGAPPLLVRGAKRAMADERRHARVMARLARVPVPRVATNARPARSVRRMAMENAVEGCVRETFGALVAASQARDAPDAPTRAAFGSVAHDEARHADLAWDVHRWALSRLPARDREAIEREMSKARAALAHETSGVARTLLDALFAHDE